MKNFLKEIPWIFLGIIVGLIASYRFGIQAITDDSTLDVNLYDTYFVLDAIDGVLLGVFFFVFLIYILRSLKQGHKSLSNLMILIISGIGLIFIFDGILNMIGVAQSLFPNIPISNNEGWTIYPPLSTVEVNPDPSWHYLYYFVQFSQVSVISILIYMAYRTGGNKHKNIE